MRDLHLSILRALSDIQKFNITGKKEYRTAREFREITQLIYLTDGYYV